jgi:4-hydroxybenzoyl-CoA thioesterase
MLAAQYTDEGTAPRTVLRFLAQPSSVNFGGNAHGGTVLRWIDEAAYACARSWIPPKMDHSEAIAVYSGVVHFFAPVKIGDLVEVDARLACTGTRSMHLAVRVSTADLSTPSQKTLATQCLTVFEVHGADQTGLPVPSWAPESKEDLGLHSHILDIVNLREKIVPIEPALSLAP